MCDAVPGLALAARTFILPVGPDPAFTAPNSWGRGGGQGARRRGGRGERPAGGEEENGRLLVLLQGRRRGAGRTLQCWLWTWETSGGEEEQLNPIASLFIPQGEIIQTAAQMNVRITANEAHNLKRLKWGGKGKKKAVQFSLELQNWLVCPQLYKQCLYSCLPWNTKKTWANIENFSRL